MPRTRPPYPPEFRRQIVGLVRAGETPERLAKRYEPSAVTIREWVRQADLDEGRREDGLTKEREGFGVLTLRRDRVDSEYQTYGWTARRP